MKIAQVLSAGLLSLAAVAAQAQTNAGPPVPSTPTTPPNPTMPPPPTGTPPAAKPPGVQVSPRFGDVDKNGDGKITSDELKSSSTPDNLKALDTNGDGWVSQAEFSNGVHQGGTP